MNRLGFVKLVIIGRLMSLLSHLLLDCMMVLKKRSIQEYQVL